jgi:hypothetical protein
MKRYLLRLWTEDDGFVLSSEMVLYGTVGVVGVTTGYAALRDSVNTELDDVAKALGSTDQSYYVGGVYGHSAWSAGSAYFDRVDRNDIPACVNTAAPVVVDRPTVCADIFGPAHPAVPALPGYSGVPAPAPKFIEKKVEVRKDEPKRKDPPKKDAPKKDAPKPKEEAKLPPPPPRHHHHHHRDPHPAVVVGAPGLAPCATPAAGFYPVRVMLNPHGPCQVNLPEGYFNHGLHLGAPLYQMCGPGPAGIDYGYSYAPVAPAPVYHHDPVPGVVKPNVPGPNTIDLGFTTVGDDELKHIEKLTTARCLHVLGSAVTNKGLDSICELEQLESLHIVGTQITDEGLDELEDLDKLRFLHLIGTRITDKGLPKLAKLKSLEELDLRATPVSDAAIEELKLKMPTLRVVR